MTTPAAKPRPRPRHAADDDVVEEPVVVTPTPRRCNLDGCTEVPEWRGLCPAHRQTHRGLADPKEPR